MKGKTSPDPIFFEGPEAFRSWLEANHETESEVHTLIECSEQGLDVPPLRRR